jgi:hypothetical protein
VISESKSQVLKSNSWKSITITAKQIYMNLTNFTLPEWSFLEATTHEGNALAGRTVFIHIRTNTMIEAVCLDGVLEYDFGDTPNIDLFYDNFIGLTEHHKLLVHYTFDHDRIAEILELASEWYSKYMAWEDQKIKQDGTGKHN